MGDFSRDEVESLLAQHTEETGQAFTEEARRDVWELTQGQPWLVNALAYEACFGNKAGRDRSREVTADAIQDAREQLILRRETHLDQLTDKLQEERVRRVVEPLLSGTAAADSIPADDLQYARDLGLVAQDGPVAIANPIYREVIPRDLTYTTQEMSIHHDEREYGLGRMRTDLLLVRPVGGDSGRTQKVVIECKVLHRGLERTLREGLEQTRAYMDRCAAAEGHLVLFDRTEGKSWDDKVYRREETEDGASVTVWGM